MDDTNFYIFSGQPARFVLSFEICEAVKKTCEMQKGGKKLTLKYSISVYLSVIAVSDTDPDRSHS